MHWKRLALSACLFTDLVATASLSAADTYKPYPFDDKPLIKHAAVADEFMTLKKSGLAKPLTTKELERQLQLIESISAKEPDWIDGYWMTGEAAFQLGNSYTRPDDLKTALKVFESGRDTTEKCLKKAPDNPLCKLMLGAALGKIASINGIFSSLKGAKRVEQLWLEAAASGVNHPLSPYTTLQGSTAYALGIYYRLVPDFFLTSWLFGVRGDIKKSVAYHQKAVEIDPPNVCSEVMLGVSQICLGKGKFDTDDGKKGLSALVRAKALPVTSAVTEVCAKDISRLEKDASLACGYETSRQQETSEEEFKKLNQTKEGSSAEKKTH